MLPKLAATDSLGGISGATFGAQHDRTIFILTVEKATNNAPKMKEARTADLLRYSIEKSCAAKNSLIEPT